MINTALEVDILLDSLQDYRPIQLLDAGNHNHDFDQFAARRWNEYRQRDHTHDILPRDILLDKIIESVI
jgi:hypothetical protein